MAGSMGFAVNNTKAVFQALINKKTEFVRTPKYLIKNKEDTWIDKKYVHKRVSLSVIFEILLAIYSFGCVIISLITLQISAIPFQLMFSFGFGLVAYLSIRQVIESNRRFSKETVN